LDDLLGRATFEDGEGRLQWVRIEVGDNGLNPRLAGLAFLGEIANAAQGPLKDAQGNEIIALVRQLH
jgi:hypothetical protein